MVPEQRVKTCTYQVCHMVPEQRTKTCSYRSATWWPSSAPRPAAITVCHMVPEQRVKTCTYQVCHMVPEQRTKTCSYQVCHMVQECHSKQVPYCVCHMVAEKHTKQVPYCVCKPVNYTKTITGCSLCAEAGRVHGYPLRAEGGLHASAGAGLLPESLLLPTKLEVRRVRPLLTVRGGPGLLLAAAGSHSGAGRRFLLGAIAALPTGERPARACRWRFGTHSLRIEALTQHVRIAELDRRLGSSGVE